MTTPRTRSRNWWLGAAVTVWALIGVSAFARQGAPVPEPERWTIVHCGKLLAVPGKEPLFNATVVIKDGKIESVAQGFVEPAAAMKGAAEGAVSQVVNLRGSYVLPGLIDCHVHLTFETSPDRLIKVVTESDADRAVAGVVFAKRTLEAGFTTVRDVGASGDSIFALRDAINAGKIPGPRILAAGEGITPTGGHGDNSNGFAEDVVAWEGPRSGVADGVDECRKAVRSQVKRGADVIKMTATGGVLSNIGAGLEQQLFEDELRAVCDTAHLLNKKVAAHAHGVHGINAALRAGVDSIEHGTYLDDESIRLFKEKGAYYVPTISAGKAVAAYAAFPRYYTAAVTEKAMKVGPLIQSALARAHKAGVKIAFGTDAGVFPHGENAGEFTYLVEAGMTPLEAIRSATVHAADLLGLSSEVGTVEAGKSGDLIAVEGDPTRNVEELRRVRVVIRGGELVKGGPTVR